MGFVWDDKNTQWNLSFSIVLFCKIKERKKRTQDVYV